MENVEEEYVLLYLHVINRLTEAGTQPTIAYEPSKEPKEPISENP